MHILAVEIGLPWVKAAVMDASSGNAVGEIAIRDLPVRRPSPDASEILADELWQSLAESARKAVWSAASQKVAIDGIGICCLAPLLVLLDRSDQPMRPIWTPLDGRSRPAARLLTSRLAGCSNRRPDCIASLRSRNGAISAPG